MTQPSESVVPSDSESAPNPSGGSVTTAKRPGVILGHPERFWNLAFTDLWERFSFYSLQALLAYYLIGSLDEGGLALSAAVVTSVVGAYGALAQLSMIVGSWMADRVFAPKKLVLFGALIIAGGHIALGVLPDFLGLFIGLGLVIVGTGAFKTNLSRILGALYDANPEMEVRRDSGFTIYLAATNTGAVLGPFLAGLFQTEWGFHAGFAVAAVGMFLGVAQYAVVYKKLPVATGQVVNPLQRAERGRVSAIVALFAAIATGLYFIGAFDGETLSTTVGLTVLAVIGVYYAVMFRSTVVTATEKVRLRGLLPISIAGLAFWGFSFQVFTVIPLFVTEHVNLELAGWRVPELWFASVIAIGSITVSFGASVLWNRLGDRQPASMTKIVIAFFVTVAGFVGTGLAATAFTQVPALIMLICMFTVGGAEAFFGPLIFSLGSKAMPKAFKAQGLAVMVLSIGGGSVIAGLWGKAYLAMSPSSYFFLLAGVATAIGLVLAAASPAITRAITKFD
jgi:POT family proton-dependent oligopeptide transporter